MKIVIKRTDGSISVMHLHEAAPPDGAPDETVNAVVRAEIAKWHADDQAEVLSWRAMSDDAIPTDRTFRNAWCDVTPELTIDIHMPKARDIHRDRMRSARAPLLASLDVAYQRADEAGDAAAKKQIADRKQALRDATAHPGIASATSLDELKAVWPDCLKAQ